VACDGVAEVPGEGEEALMLKWQVEVTNLRQVYDALREVDAAAVRALERDIRQAGHKVAWAAATSVPGNPVSNWGRWITTTNRGNPDLGFSPSLVASGFKVVKKNFRSRGTNRGVAWEVQQYNQGGAVFEVMGDFSRITDDPRYEKQAMHLVKMINQRFPAPNKGTRILTPAYYKGIPDPQAFTEKIRDAVIRSARANGLE